MTVFVLADSPSIPLCQRHRHSKGRRLFRTRKISHSIWSAVIVLTSVYRDRRRGMGNDSSSQSECRTVYIPIAELMETEAVRFEFSTTCSGNSAVFPRSLRKWLKNGCRKLHFQHRRRSTRYHDTRVIRNSYAIRFICRKCSYSTENTRDMCCYWRCNIASKCLHTDLDYM